MRRLIAIAVALATLGAAREVLAVGGTLTAPSLSVSAASGRDAKDWLDVLSKQKYKFVVGDFINSTTNLYYSGDTASLNDFLADLSAVEGTTLRITFSKDSKTAESAFADNNTPRGPCQWQIQHLGTTPDVFDVTIFLGDGKIDVSQLAIPAIQTPKKAEPAKPKP